VGLNSHEGGFHENQNGCLSLISDIDQNSSAGLFLIRQLNISLPFLPFDGIIKNQLDIFAN
jgi:hypothetical protein